MNEFYSNKIAHEMPLFLQVHSPKKAGQINVSRPRAAMALAKPNQIKMLRTCAHLKAEKRRIRNNASPSRHHTGVEIQITISGIDHGAEIRYQ